MAKGKVTAVRAKKVSTKLKSGDKVMVVAGGHKTKRPNKGQVGKLLRFVGTEKDRVVVEGLNMHTKHKRATQPGENSGKLQVEAPVHISNVMFYAEKIEKPVRLKYKSLEDGRKVRGYTDPSSGKFVQIDS
ncbi:MAG: 50S ribosomal protein L24 [Bdellovibrionales bacterium]|nr:50S ribosomal protein L24 [Bdellovibrionales bacterium]